MRRLFRWLWFVLGVPCLCLSYLVWCCFVVILPNIAPLTPFTTGWRLMVITSPVMCLLLTACACDLWAVFRDRPIKATPSTA
jgi:hypothetical protein